MFKRFLLDILTDEFMATGSRHSYPWALSRAPLRVFRILYLRVRCGLSGHAMLDSGSYSGPESAGDSFSCLCGREHFSHTYY